MGINDKAAFGKSLFDALEQGSKPEPKKISMKELRKLCVDTTKERLTEKGSIHGIRASYTLFGGIENWELFGDYYQSPKESKKSLKTKWLTLVQLLEKAIEDYDVDKDEINCGGWKGLPGAAFTPNALGNNLESTITNYKITGVPLTFGIMSALLFTLGLVGASPVLKKKVGKEGIKSLAIAFIVSELGMYEGGPLGGMNPEILAWIGNMYTYSYKGVYMNEQFETIKDEWEAAFGKKWMEDAKSENVFAAVELGFNLVAIAKKIETGTFDEERCPQLMGYTFAGLDTEDITQLALLCMLHRRAAQGAGVSDNSNKSKKMPLVNFIDMDWYDANFNGKHMIDIATKRIIGYMNRIVAIKGYEDDEFGGM